MRGANICETCLHVNRDHPFAIRVFPYHVGKSEDRPTFRSDAARSGHTSEPIAKNPFLLWTYQQADSVRPAWPRSDRMTFDRATEPIVASRLVYFGSSADGSIHALDEKRAQKNGYSRREPRFALPPVFSGAKSTPQAMTVFSTVSMPLPDRSANKVFESFLVNRSHRFVICFVMHRKNHLREKDCPVCGRPFSWRKKWESCWDEVRYCSERCRRNRRANQKTKQTSGNAS